MHHSYKYDIYISIWLYADSSLPDSSFPFRPARFVLPDSSFPIRPEWTDNPSIQKREWNVESLDSYRTNNHQEGNNHRINCRITPSIAGNLWTFMKAMMKEQICQSRMLFQFEHGGRFALRKKVYREDEERVEILMFERTNGNLDTMQFLDAMYHRIGE